MATLTVKTSGGNYPATESGLQSAINAAVAGDTITIEANVTITGTVQLTNKGVLGSNITITTDAAAGNLPTAGNRTGPNYSAFLPKLKSAGGGSPVIFTAESANHWKLQHLEILHVPQGYSNMVQLGSGNETLVSQMPYDLTVDQCYFKGDPAQGQQRAVYLACGNVTITNSYFENIKTPLSGAESQCIAGVNTVGPFLIENNFLEASSMSFLLGGGDPTARVRMTTTGNVSTTGADVSCDTGHTLSELEVGQRISIMVGSTVEHTFIATINGTGATGSITWSPALSGNPSATAGYLRAGVVPKDLTFRRNHVSKKSYWRDGWFAAPTSPSAVSDTVSGTLATGTYYYKLVPYTPNGWQGGTHYGVASAEVSATLAATGKITVNADVVTGAEYRLYRGTSSGSYTEYTASATLPIVDNGGLSYVAGSIPSGTRAKVKNMFELKSCIGAQVDSNIFEYNWSGFPENGYSVWLKSVNQDGQGWWCEGRNITLEKNIFRHGTGWIVFNGKEHYGTQAPPVLSNVTIKNNLVYDHGPTWGIERFAFQAEDTDNLTIDHNTVINITNLTGGGIMFMDATQPLNGLVIKNNLLRRETYGILASGGSEGTSSLNACSPDWIFVSNAVAGANSGIYPTNNLYPTTSAWEAEFVNYVATGVGADFHVDNAGPWDNAGTDGLDLGADINLVETATNGVDTGTPGPGATDPKDAEFQWQTVTFFSPAGTLPEDSTFSWQAISFFPSPGIPSLTSPLDGAVSVAIAPTLAWAAASDATTYDVYVDTVNPPVTIVSADQAGTSAVVSPNLVNATVYYWKIVSKNGAGSASSVVRSFTTVSAPSPGGNPTKLKIRIV